MVSRNEPGALASCGNWRMAKAGARLHQSLSGNTAACEATAGMTPAQLGEKTLAGGLAQRDGLERRQNLIFAPRTRGRRGRPARPPTRQMRNRPRVPDKPPGTDDARSPRVPGRGR